MALPAIKLAKSEVGQPKASIHKLPGPNFIYGKSAFHEHEDAKDVINGWNIHKPSNDVINEKDFKKLNTLCVKNKITDARDVQEFRKGRNIKLPKLQGAKELKLTLPDGQFIFGIPNKPSTPMNLVMSNDYGNKAAAIKLEIYKTPRPEHKLTLTPKVNKSVQLKQLVISRRLKEIEKGPQKLDGLFKLQRFRDVSPRIMPINEEYIKAKRGKSLNSIPDEHENELNPKI